MNPLLGWDRLPAVIVKVSSIAAGEYAENEIRKDFTISERVAIAKTLKEQIGERRGGDQITQLESKRDNGPVCLPEERTRDYIAKQVDFGSGREFERAEKVVDKGSTKLKAAMDEGTVAISVAAKLAELVEILAAVASLVGLRWPGRLLTPFLVRGRLRRFWSGWRPTRSDVPASPRARDQAATRWSWSSILERLLRCWRGSGGPVDF